MKEYPHIPGSRKHKIAYGTQCTAYYKYDGSNMRWEWNKKKGWYKFGLRNRLFDSSEVPYNQGIPIFLNNIAPTLERIVLKEFKGISKFIVYTEFFGKSSFAGNHNIDEEKQLVLIDINIHPKGFINPNIFNELFFEQPYFPKIIYSGSFNHKLIVDVRNGVYPVNEGVVCKGVDRRGCQWMVKIKTNAYLEKLKNSFGLDWEKYAE